MPYAQLAQEDARSRLLFGLKLGQGQRPRVAWCRIRLCRAHINPMAAAQTGNA